MRERKVSLVQNKKFGPRFAFSMSERIVFHHGKKDGIRIRAVDIGLPKFLNKRMQDGGSREELWDPDST